MNEPVMVGGAPTEPSNRRALILLGVAAVVAVLVLVLPKLLFAGDEPVDDLTAPPAVIGITPGDEVTDGIVAEPARTFEVFSTKNPFTPLIDTTPVAAVAAAPPGTVAAGVAPAVSADGTPVGTSGTAVVVPDGSTPAGATTSPPEAAGATPSGGAAVEPVSSQRVSLLEVFVDGGGKTVASVRVNDTVHEVAEGATFATRYTAVTLSVADGCGQFLDGDGSFRLCEGEELLK